MRATKLALIAAAASAALALPAAAQLNVPSPTRLRVASPAAGGDDSRAVVGRDRFGREVVSLRLSADRDELEPGERPTFRLRATGSAFVAVLNVAPNGEVQVLYPASPWDRGRRGGPLALALSPERWPRRGEGVGYVMAVASSWPLEVDSLAGWMRRGWRPDVRVAGDPYRAMRRLVQLLVPDRDDLLAVDRIAYRVGGRSLYPQYACYGDFASWLTASDEPRFQGCGGVFARLRRDRDYYVDPEGFGRDVYGRRDDDSDGDDGFGRGDGRSHGGSGWDGRNGGSSGWNGGSGRGGQYDPRDRRRPGDRRYSATIAPDSAQLLPDSLMLPDSLVLPPDTSWDAAGKR